MTSQGLDTLEQMINTHGLKAVLSAIGELCIARAGLSRLTYNDQTLAKQWARTGASLLVRAARVTV